MRSYSAKELEQATGFDRRTIAYYVQMGLIPKVGRRGPRTRYPKIVLDRLLAIRRIREAEEAGEIRPVSLADMGEIFSRAPAELLAQVADRQVPVAAALPGEAVFTARSPQARSMARETAWSAQEVREPSVESMLDAPQRKARTYDATVADSPSSLTDAETELGDALSELQTRARNRRRQQGSQQGSVDQWSRVEISPDVALSVRGVTDEDAPLLESVGKELRRLISRGQERSER